MTGQIAEAMSKIYSYMTDDHQGNWGMDMNQWDWVPGVGIISILDYGEKSGQEETIQYVEKWVEQNKHKGDALKVINAMAPLPYFLPYIAAPRGLATRQVAGNCTVDDE